MDSSRNLAALAAVGGPYPLKYPQGARGEYLRAPALALGSGFLRPGERLAAATRRRRTPSRHQARDRADLTRGSAPRPSSRPWCTFL